jgi:assimilatory nitrate reductase electron transfer subunit
MTNPTRIVLIGYGPVGARFVEELLPAVRSGAVTLTVLGAEEHSAYNRVLLAEYAVGRAERERLEIADDSAFVGAGVRLRLGETASGINRSRQTVSLFGTDETVAYDRLVLATGARANIPTLVGMESSRLGLAPSGLDQTAAGLPHGVEVLRDLRDGDVIRAAVEAGERIVVLGAGVLGMELALAAQEQGAQVVVVHHGDGPMARNLDTDGGRMLARAARTAGVEVVGHSRAESVLLRTRQDGRLTFDALVCADNKQIDGDLLVLSCGVGARSELAARAGLAVGRGVLVDDELRSWTDPDIFAIGDCAHITGSADAVSGGPTGLIGPGWRQADWLAAFLVAEVHGERREALQPERRSTVMLKSEHVHVVSAGTVDADPWDEQLEVSQWIDRCRGGYAKIVARDGVLEGFVSVGMPRLGAELTLLFERGSVIPADPAVLLRLDAVGASAESSAAPSPDDTVCWCNGVQAKTISACAARGVSTVEGVGAETRAGTGCGGCKGRIAQLIAATPNASPAAV